MICKHLLYQLLLAITSINNLMYIISIHLYYNNNTNLLNHVIKKKNLNKKFNKYLNNKKYPT